MAMLGRRDQWLLHAQRLAGNDLRQEVEAGFAALVESDLQALAAQFDAGWQRRLMPLARFAAVNGGAGLEILGDWCDALSGSAEDLHCWRAIAEGIAAACAEAAQGEIVEPVNFNANGQTVIAGHKAAVERAMLACKARGAKMQGGNRFKPLKSAAAKLILGNPKLKNLEGLTPGAIERGTP